MVWDNGLWKGIKANCKEDQEVVHAALKAKSELYDQIESSGPNSNSVSLAASSCLVSFENKTGQSKNQGNQPKKPAWQFENEDGDDEEIEIVDDFGRTRRMLKRSREYQVHILEAETRRHDANNNYSKVVEAGGGKNVIKGEGRWAWSNGGGGTVVDSTIAEEAANQKRFRTLVSERVGKEIQHCKDDKSSRVNTQWESTLHSSSKKYLAEIHEETKEKRQSNSSSILAEGAASRVGETVVEGKASSSSSADLRRELLRKKLEIKKTAS